MPTATAALVAVLINNLSSRLVCRGNLAARLVRLSVSRPTSNESAVLVMLPLTNCALRNEVQQLKCLLLSNAPSDYENQYMIQPASILCGGSGTSVATIPQIFPSNLFTDCDKACCS
jgi:hypothetical protein